jgi:di/tricarboxylate transporter
LIAEVEGSAPPRMSMLIPALILTVGAYACYVAKLSELIACAMVAAILMVITGILSESEARDAIQWQIYLTIAAAFGIGEALVNSGLANSVAILLVRLGDAVGIGDAGLLGAIYLSTVLISQCVANNAAAALIFPIAMEAAVLSGIDRELMAINIMLAASAAFMTPFGYQTNLMVMGPGGYSTLDYLIFGTPMQIVLALISVYAQVSPLWVSWSIGKPTCLVDVFHRSHMPCPTLFFYTAFTVLVVAAAFRVMQDRRQLKYKMS